VARQPGLWRIWTAISSSATAQEVLRTRFLARFIRRCRRLKCAHVATVAMMQR
jgi:hypothetical protein